MSRKLMKASAAEQIFKALLQEELAIGLDAAFFSTSAASPAAHAGLLNSVAPIAPTIGGDLQAVLADVINLSNAVSAGGSGAFALFSSPERAVRLQLLLPHMRIPVLPSAAIPANRLIGGDPQSIVTLIDPTPEVLTSTAGVVHMEDTTPLEIVSGTGPTTADPVRSLWQTDSVALAIRASMAFAKRRSNAIGFIDEVTW